MIKNHDFNSLYELLDFFTCESVCEEYLAFIRWGEEPRCPYCQEKRVNALNGKTKRYKCYGCRRQFTVRVGTIFHNSKLPLRKWFVAIHFCSMAKGISSHQLSRELNISQEAAWFMLHRIRETFEQSQHKFKKRKVEIDETLFGGLEKNKHKGKKTPHNQGRSTKTKAGILGIIERGENKQVYAVHVPRLDGNTILPIIESKVAKGSTVYTDEYRPYRKLRHSYRHKFVNHSQGKYVIDDAHTNGIENFWSLLKKNLTGTYHSISKHHLQRYINEVTFKYNNKTDRFSTVLKKAMDVRIEYKQLIKGK
jgi:transposase-like protein